MSPSGQVLVVTGGHRVDLDAFLDMVAAICDERGWRWAHARQPSAQEWLRPEVAGTWDAILCHDIPGLRLQRGEPPDPRGPDDDVRSALVELLRHGQGLVATHHSLAGWPQWDGWARALGGRFLYAPGRLDGEAWPSSGTRITRYRAQVVEPRHPVCAGVGDFELTDELYICPIFEDRVVPLVRADADFDGRLFVSTYEHVLFGAEAAPDCAHHPRASDVIAWAKAAERSPLVYVQPGDTAETFGLEPYRRLVGNALAWVASPDAKAWARAHAESMEESRSP
jgi:type 1 glutamine amidotransferase